MTNKPTSGHTLPVSEPNANVIAREVLNTPHLNGGYNTDLKRITLLIAAAIHDAKLEGAKAMQEAASELFNTPLSDLGALSGYEIPKRSCTWNEAQKAIRQILPEEVVK